MDVSHFPPPPSPWPDRVARDLEVLLLSILVGFCLWFVGSWVLAGPVAPSPPDAPIFSDDESTPDVDAASSSGVNGWHHVGTLALAVTESVVVTEVGPAWADLGPGRDARQGLMAPEHAPR